MLSLSSSIIVYVIRCESFFSKNEEKRSIKDKQDQLVFAILPCPTVSTMMILKFYLLMVLVGSVFGHGMLAVPPSRSSAWRFGYDTPVNYDDWTLNCGGFQHQWDMDGKCGVCGDPIDGVRKNEAPNGKYFTGVPTHTYKAGSVIDVHVEILAHHMGWFWFKICPVMNHSVEVTQECFDRYPLEIVEAPTKPATPYEWIIPGTYTDKIDPEWDIPVYRFKLKLPQGLSCDRCVLQWDWKNANRWQWDPPNYGFGYGKQETFRGCADVSIDT